MEEIKIQAIKKVIENIELEKNRRQDCYQCRHFPESLHEYGSAETDPICQECVKKEKQRLQECEKRLEKWKNKLKGENNE